MWAIQTSNCTNNIRLVEAELFSLLLLHLALFFASSSCYLFPFPGLGPVAREQAGLAAHLLLATRHGARVDLIGRPRRRSLKHGFGRSRWPRARDCQFIRETKKKEEEEEERIRGSE